MKNKIYLLLFFLPSLAFADGTLKLSCTTEDSRMGQVAPITIYLENGFLYAPIFHGDLASGKNAVSAKYQAGTDRVFEKADQGDKITVTLTEIGHALDLTNWKYVERIDPKDAGSSLLKTGFCTSQTVN